MKVTFKAPRVAPPPENVTIELSWDEAVTIHLIVGALSKSTLAKMGAPDTNILSDLYGAMNEIRRDAHQPELKHKIGELLFNG